MKSFTVCIIFKIECEGVRTEQYEEQWRLILAANEQDALQQARETAIHEEERFTDRHGRMVQWKFLAIKDIQETAIQSGALLFSMLRETDPVAAPIWGNQIADVTL